MAWVKSVLESVVGGRCPGCAAAQPGSVPPQSVKVTPVDCTLLPMALFATTLHVYDFPLMRPVTVIGDFVPLAVWVPPPLLDVQVTV